MADIRLYTNPMSRGRIARWMLEEVGVDYDVTILGYDGSMAAEDYRAINPMAKVPAIDHGGSIVTECAAICAYLAAAFPDAGLAPSNDVERAAYYRWMFFAAGPLEQAVGDRMLKAEPTDEQKPVLGYGDFDRTVDTLDHAVGQHAFIAGDRFTAADVYVGSHLMWGTQFGTIPARAAFTDYVGRLSERPAYRRATEKDDALMPAQD